MFTDRISVLKARLVEGLYGDYMDWDNPVLTPVPAPVTVQPLTSSEQYDGLGTTVTEQGWRVISAPGHIVDSIKSSDRVSVEGMPGDFEVDGEPQHWRGIMPHSEFRLKRYEGMGV